MCLSKYTLGSDRFYMTARLGEHQFDIVTGKSLNETKNRATAEALRQLKKQGLYTQTQVKI